MTDKSIGPSSRLDQTKPLWLGLGVLFTIILGLFGSLEMILFHDYPINCTNAKTLEWKQACDSFLFNMYTIDGFLISIVSISWSLFYITRRQDGL